MAELGSIGPYRLIRLLGAGGMGEVFLARDERLDRKVAIKRMRPSSEVSAGHRERFRREARIVARLKHPAIVQIHDVVRDGEIDCIVMEYVEGEDLRRRMDAAPLSLHEALAIGRQITLAMADAHDQGIIHRDLKSENVLVTRAGEVKITDFGIAKDLRDETLTADGHVIGTYRAMSPEQALGRPLDHRSDLFSFGVLLYEALTGTSPFRAETPFLTLQRVVHGEITPLRHLQPALPAALVALIEQLLQKDPLLRPRDFHEVADTLAEIQGEVPGKPCSGTKASHRPPIDYDGDTLGSEPGPTPASGNAPPAARSGPAGSGTPAASPAAMRNARAVLGIAATEPSDRPIVPAPADPAAATVPAARVAVAGAAAAKPGDRSVSAEAPSARPVRWRQYTRRIAVLAVTGVALTIVLALRYGSGRPDESGAPIRVAVPRPSIRPYAELTHDPLAATVRAAIVRGLLDIEGISPLPVEDIDLVTEGFEQEHRTPPLQHELAKLVGAHELCAARLECTLQSCRVSLTRVGGDGITRKTETFEVAPDDLRGSDEAVRIYLRHLYPDHRAAGRSTGPQMDPADHEEFLRLRAAYWGAAQPAPASELIDRLDVLRARARSAIDVHRFEAEVLQHRYAQTADAQYLERALAVIREAEAQAPDSHPLLISRFEIALQAGQHEEAENALRRIEMLDPGSATTWRLRGRWHAEVGEHEQALVLLQRAVAVDSSWRSLYHLASVEDDLGMQDKAQLHIDQLLTRSPSNYAALSLRANIERNHGSPACARALYLELVARKPYYQECLQLGISEMMMDLHDDAARSFQRALDARPGDARALFNLAESLKLAGDAGAATREFRRLLDALHARGERTADERMIEVQVLAHLAENDPALAGQARTLLQRMLEEKPPSAPGRSPVLYRAAVVHALLGEHDRAAEHVRALLDKGWTTEWFRFPWFDGVRQDPTLRQRLAYAPPARACTPASRRPPGR